MNKSSPEVSIIMAVNKTQPHLVSAINSILNQTFTDFEFIIVANNCSDELYNELAGYSDSRIILHRTSIGQLSFNLNFALNATKSEYIFRMDADDVSHPERIEKQLLYMKKYNLDVLGTSVNLVNANDEIIGERATPLTNKNIRRRLPFSNPIVHPSVCYKKSVIIKNKGYLGGVVSEDYGLWLRLSRNRDINFENLSEKYLNYRVHPTESQGNPLAYSESIGLLTTEFFVQKKLSYLLGIIYFSIKKILRSK